MTKVSSEFPSGTRELLWTTFKLLLIVSITAFSCGAAYGWDVGAKVWVGFSIIIIVSQCWASRKDLAHYFKSR